MLARYERWLVTMDSVALAIPGFKMRIITSCTEESLAAAKMAREDEFVEAVAQIVAVFYGYPDLKHQQSTSASTSSSGRGSSREDRRSTPVNFAISLVQSSRARKRPSTRTRTSRSTSLWTCHGMRHKRGSGTR